MEILIDIINFILAAIMIMASGTWIVLIRSMLISFRDSPYLDKFEKKDHSAPKVSVILPARNEEEFIGDCLSSLEIQDYENYEIVVIDDSSEDSTSKIIKEHAKNESKIKFVSAGPKPDDWIGKNWPCSEGFKASTGELLLFTDSDTKHSKSMISLAVDHFTSFNLDALTVIPKMLCLDTWTKITLPMICTFLHTRFSALRVNDPTKNTGYFFGSFFIIKKQVYESVGTHEGVKNEIIEDGALGKKVKESGFKMKMVRGEHLVDAVWARDWSTLWNALKRLMIPLYLQNSSAATGIFFAVSFLLFMPFPLLVYSGYLFHISDSFEVLFFSSIVTSILVYVGGIIEARKGLSLNIGYAFLCPIGGLIVAAGFLSGIINATSKSGVSWRGRKYSMKEQVQNSVNV